MTTFKEDSYVLVILQRSPLFSSSSIIIKSRIRWAENVGRMGRRRMSIGFCWESQRERDHEEDQDVGGWIILGWILERWDEVMWAGLVWFRIGTGGELL
jgi:hypothetical protein